MGIAHLHPNNVVEDLKDKLCELGARYGNNYPWHRSTDAFHILVAEFLLRRTTRVIISDVFPLIIHHYPTAKDLSNAKPDDLNKASYRAGLKQRNLQLIELAERIAALGGVPKSKKKLLSLGGVGPYICDAVRLYAFGIKCFPLDRNVQRTSHRIFRGKEPANNERPYSDTFLHTTAGKLTHNLGVRKTRNLHQGMLLIAWEFCRARPICKSCPARSFCANVLNGDA